MGRTPRQLADPRHQGLTHPEFGRYTLDWQVLRSPGEGQTLMVMTAPPDSRSVDVLQRLAAVSALEPSGRSLLTRYASKGKRHEHTIAREVREETGLTVKAGGC